MAPKDSSMMLILLSNHYSLWRCFFFSFLPFNCYSDSYALLSPMWFVPLLSPLMLLFYKFSLLLAFNISYWKRKHQSHVLLLLVIVLMRSPRFIVPSSSALFFLFLFLIFLFLIFHIYFPPVHPLSLSLACIDYCVDFWHCCWGQKASALLSPDGECNL